MGISEAEEKSSSVVEPQVENHVSEPSGTVDALERWNKPRINAWRFSATLLAFLNMGMNDGAVGALIPYLETYYSLSYTVVSLLFLAPFVGYMSAALINNQVHLRFGQLGIAVIAPVSKLIAFAVFCAHPPYPVLPVILCFAGFGNGLEDGGYNAWIGNMFAWKALTKPPPLRSSHLLTCTWILSLCLQWANANELLGILHAFYGLGATLAPLIATSMVTGGLAWYTFYYIMVGAAVLELLAGFLAFRHATASKHRAATNNNSSEQSRTKEALRNRISWICAIFLFGYVGVEVSLGGWLVTFMLRVRHGGQFAAGMTATGFWLGITMGRLILGFVTPRIGEKLAIAIYLLLSMALELLFWLIPNFISSAIFAAFLGFFMGPLFPAAVVVATKLLPAKLHVSAVGFAAAFGGGGAALFPFVVGAIATAKGVQVLQPIVLALLAAILALWCLLPGGFRKAGLEMSRNGEGDRAQGMEMAWLRKRLPGVRKKVADV